MKKRVNDVSERVSTLSPVQIGPTKGEGAFAARSLPNVLREDV